MELALVVYLVNLLTEFNEVVAMLVTFYLMGGIAFSLIYLMATESLSETSVIVKKYIFFKTAFFFGFLCLLIPSEKTMQYMAGAYLVQTVYTSEFVNKAAPLAQKAVLNQLETWAKDNDQVKELLSTVVPTTIPAVVEQIK